MYVKFRPTCVSILMLVITFRIRVTTALSRFIFRPLRYAWHKMWSLWNIATVAACSVCVSVFLLIKTLSPEKNS